MVFNINKKLSLLAIIVLISILSVPVIAGIIPVKDLKDVESILYGESYKSEKAIIDRIGELENVLFGYQGKGSLQERANDIITYVTGKEDKPSLILLVNTLEWTLKNEVTRGHLLDRLNQLEENIYGETKTEPVINRIQKLKELILPDDSLTGNRAKLTTGTGISIRTLEKINTADLTSGQLIEFEIEKNIKVKNTLIIPAGTVGTLKVSELKKAGNFGKDASLKLTINDIMAMDGSMIPLQFRLKEENNNSREIAVGLSFLGTVIMSHPVGIVAGYFYKGKDIEVPAGTLMEVEVSRDLELQGMKLE